MLRGLAGTLAGVLLMLLSPSASLADPGQVVLPASQWEAALRAVKEGRAEVPPPEEVLQVGRVLDGRFHKGVLEATLSATVELVTDEVVRVPVVDGQASILAVRVDGRTTSLLREGSVYTAGVRGRGRHHMEVELVHGREDDRFDRHLSLALPPSGPTRVSIRLPEPDVEATLAHGAVTSVRTFAEHTLVDGALDASGVLDLSWRRQATHRGPRDFRAEAEAHVVHSLQEAVVEGVLSLDYAVLEGETDRLELSLPPDVEVVEVTGDAVLQWLTTRSEAGEDRVSVLLRYLVEAGVRGESQDHAAFQVRFQYPVYPDQAVVLRTPLPAEGVPVEGSLGVQAPAGLAVEVEEVSAAQSLTLRDLPPGLTELTASPLLLGFSFEAPPEVRLELTRREQVELTSTVVDDIQASTVLLGDGTEVGKLRLRLRNNTRQHLGVRLPEGAEATHALVDGRPIRPALGDGVLLFPLRQSAREDQTVLHEVRPGETLSGIARHHYSDAGQYSRILWENPDVLASADDLEPGQLLRIPALESTGEQSFVLELAYRRQGPALGAVGARTLELPQVDADVMDLTWHLYLPAHLEPLRMGANLTALEQLHPAPLQRVLNGLMRLHLVGVAHAGGGSYENILRQRKVIYEAEESSREDAGAVVSTFPLVGDLYRFERVLLGQDTARVRVSWVHEDAVPPIRWAALLLAAVLGLLALRPGWQGKAVAGVGLVGLLVVAHHVLGVHRRILWGADLALVLALARPLWTTARAWKPAPRAWLEGLSWSWLGRLLLVVVVVHLLLGWPSIGSALVLLPILLITWWRVRS